MNSSNLTVGNTPTESLTDFLDQQVERFNRKDFIQDDPISIPHRFQKKQDREIAGFWTAILSWGQRKTIVNKGLELMHLMDEAPHDFVLNHQEKDRKRFLDFVHRTFQPPDALYFLEFLQRFYREHDSLEEGFFTNDNMNVQNALIHFHQLFFDSGDYLKRTKKHIACPSKNSTCKRLNMFLRWMVRSDTNGVDFGMWKKCGMENLMIPMDIHVFKISRKLGLLKREKPDWKAVVELTATLKKFDPSDPVKYDFALFGLGVLESRKLRTP